MARTPAMLTALFGVITIFVTYLFGALPESVAAQSCAIGGVMLPFEFARSAGDLEALFGQYGMDCHQLRIEAMNAQNALDLRAYIPAYSAFMACAAIYLGGRAPLARAAILCAVGAALADIWETTALLDLANRMNRVDAFASPAQFAPALDVLTIASRLKFGLIGLHGVLIGALCLTLPKRRLIVGVLALAAAPAIAVLLLSPPTETAMHQIYMGLMFLAWTPILLIALKESVFPRPA